MESYDSSSDFRGWVYALAAGGACIFGASVVFWDVLLARLPCFQLHGDISQSAQFQVASMSLGAGVLLFSAFSNLVPQSEAYFGSPLLAYSVRQAAGLLTIAGFFVGAGLCMGLSDLIHRYTPENIVHCGAHEDDGDDDKHSTDEGLRGQDDQVFDSHHQPVLDHRSKQISSRARTDAIPSSIGRFNSNSNASQARMQDCSLGYIGGHSPGTPFKSASTPRPNGGIRAFSQGSDAIAKRGLRHYHKRCDNSGVCAGYTAPCFAAECVCDGHPMIRSARNSSRTLITKSRESLIHNTSDGQVSSEAMPDLEANERSRLLDKKVPQRRRVSAGQTEESAESEGETESNESSDNHSSKGRRHLHHHHHDDDSAKMLRIGISTSIAICLHKAPEGFITFISAHADRQLGLTLFLAIALHNISEGAVIAYPLLVATGSRLKAFGWAAALGGLSGPVGALLGFVLTRAGFLHRDDPWTPVAYGILFAVVAGFMSTIAIQSMLPAAIKADKTNARSTTIWFTIGIGIIALAGALTKD